MDDECNCPPCEEGLPPWLATFADMMALLMCFFVLLLSFAELDVLKFKQVAGALKLAFGVQRIVKATEIPKGTSVIAKQYSPGKPTEVTPLEIMREKTTDDTKTNLDYTDSTSRNDGGMGEAEAEIIARQKAEREAQAQAEELQDELAAAIGDGLLEVEAFNDRVLIRIRERGSFGSGRAELKPEFLRAASVVHFFIREGDVDPERMEVRAMADNEPIVPNDSWDNRAKNRRVEISVLHGNHAAIEGPSPATNVDYVDQPDG